MCSLDSLSFRNIYYLQQNESISGFGLRLMLGSNDGEGIGWVLNETRLALADNSWSWVMGIWVLLHGFYFAYVWKCL